MKSSVFWKNLIGLLVMLVLASACVLSNDLLLGNPAFSLTQALDLSSFPTFSHPLWHALVSILSQLPGPLAIKLNLFSITLGIASTLLLFSISWHLPHGLTSEHRHSPVKELRLRLLGAWVTVLCFAGSVPVWMGFAYPHPQALGLCLLLALSFFTLRTFQERSTKGLNLVAVGWGLLLAEYPTAWLFAPGFGLAVLATGFSVNGRFRWGRNFRVLALVLCGFSLTLLTAYRVTKHPGAEFQSLSEFGRAFYTVLSVQKKLIVEAAPWQGGLAIALLVVGPFLAIFSPKAYQSLQHRSASHFLHLVCTLVVFLMLAHVPIAPWPLYLKGELVGLMLAPYALLALTTGYLGSYWLTVFAKTDIFQPVWVQVLRFVLRRVYLPMLIVTLIGLLAWNGTQYSVDWVAKINGLAREMAEDLEDSSVFIGDTGYNHLLRVALWEQGRSCELIDSDPMLWTRKNFRLLVQSRFADRLQLAALADVGLGPLLQQWLKDDLTSSDSSSLLLGNFSDLVFRTGFVPLPQRFGDRAVRELPINALRDQAAGLRNAWQVIDVEAVQDILEDERVPRYAKATLHRYLLENSRRANNMGFFLERKDLEAEAVSCYRMARHLSEGNLSALLNLHALSPLLEGPERLLVSEEVEKLVQGLGQRRYNQWQLSSVCGYISDPRAHLERGMAFVVSGKPNMAVRELKVAMERSQPSPVIRSRLAQAHLMNQDWDEAEKEYVALLEQNPDDPSALLGMLRLYALRGEAELAEGYLERLELLKVDPETLHREQVALLAFTGRAAEALKRQQAWIEHHPKDNAARLIAAELALQTGDRELAEQQVDALLTAERTTHVERTLLGNTLMDLGQHKDARRAYEAALKQAPHYLAAQEGLLRHALAMSDSESQKNFAHKVLRYQPDHPMASLILGAVLLEEERVEEAIGLFEASLSSVRNPDTLNALAYALYLSDRVGEALPYAEEAIRANPDHPSYLDTLGMVQLGLGNHEAALEALETAVSLQAGSNPEILLHLAEVLHATGKDAAVRDIVDRLRSLGPELPEKSRQKLDRFVRRI